MTIQLQVKDSWTARFCKNWDTGTSFQVKAGGTDAPTLLRHSSILYIYIHLYICIVRENIF